MTTTTGSQQEIVNYKRDSKPLRSHFSPLPGCVPALGGGCDFEVVTLTSGPLKGRRAIVTWGLNLPTAMIRQPSFGLNQHRAVKAETSETVDQDVCELLVAVCQE